MHKIEVGRKLNNRAAREHQARCITLLVDDVYEKDNKLIVNTKDTISIGDKINFGIIMSKTPKKVFETFYVCNSFSVSVNNKEAQINEFELNDTTVYALPFLGLNKQLVGYNDYLVGAYLSVEGMDPLEEDEIYLVYRFLNHTSYESLLEHLKTTHNFVTGEKYCKDERFDIIKMKLSSLTSDFSKYKKGMYSKISDRAKSLITRFHCITDDKDPIYAVLDRSEWYGRELSDIFDIPFKELQEYKSKPSLTKEAFKV